jgi:hypothetical protein
MRGEAVSADELFRAERVAEAAPDRSDFEAVFGREPRAAETEYSSDEIADLFGGAFPAEHTEI